MMKNTTFIVRAKMDEMDLKNGLANVYKEYNAKVSPYAEIRNAWKEGYYINREKRVQIFYANGLHRIDYQIFKKDTTDFVIVFSAWVTSELDNARFKNAYMPGLEELLKRKFKDVIMYRERKEWILEDGYCEENLYRGGIPFESYLLHDIEAYMIHCNGVVSWQRERYEICKKEGNVAEMEKCKESCLKHVKEYNIWCERYNTLAFRKRMEMPEFD